LSGKAFGFGVSATLSKKNFALYCENFDSGQRGTMGPWFGWFSNRLNQGDVGEASYATIPLLARIHAARGVPDWNTYGLAVMIEEARHRIRNPPIPSWLNANYQTAWQQLVELALRDLQNASDPLLVSSTIAAIAVGKGQSASVSFLPILITILYRNSAAVDEQQAAGAAP
jgi:hypothetical protein